MRKQITFIAVVLAVIALAANVAAQSPPRPAAPPRIVIVAAQPTTSIDGATLFEAYCASCHGSSGRGNGPAARAIPTPVPDLTRYSQAHEGDCLMSLLATLQTGHRSQTEPKVSDNDPDMPNWAPIFRSMSSNNEGLMYLRLRNVAQHVAKLQVQK
jgi:cytochrome c553